MIWLIKACITIQIFEMLLSWFFKKYCSLWNTAPRFLAAGWTFGGFLLYSCAFQRQSPDFPVVLWIGGMWYLCSNLRALTPHYLTDESLWAGRQTVLLRRFVTQGLPGLCSVSDTLAQCLHHWQDCHSYLSQLCLAIRLGALCGLFFLQSTTNGASSTFRSRANYLLSGWMFVSSFPTSMTGRQRSTFTLCLPTRLSKSECYTSPHSETSHSSE